MPNEWDQFATAHQVGDEVEGFVTNVTDFGLFVELAPGVEGLCHISEVERRGTSRSPPLFERGQRVRTRLIRIDWNEKRIGLSLRGIPQPEPAEAGLRRPEQEAEEIALESGSRAGRRGNEAPPTKPASNPKPEQEPQAGESIGERMRSSGRGGGVRG